ncbi:unnamed protein product [Rangifer tarandus platyrhynchus]|uniref:Secreted protein n=1 Tax=Rangifer tarandus platyrhynchus TaxID=3082113 RepID=A0ABN8ZR44_RANTA|nr:unnamed protein product [Rangifer tarandus platyrhynchus]
MTRLATLLNGLTVARTVGARCSLPSWPAGTSVAQLSHSGLVVDPHPLGSVWVRPGLSPLGGWRGRAWGARASLQPATRVCLERASGRRVHDEARTRPADSVCTGNTDGSPCPGSPDPTTALRALRPLGRLKRLVGPRPGRRGLEDRARVTPVCREQTAP